jgi:tetratricopeptide (TPR) repeat protein
LLIMRTSRGAVPSQVQLAVPPPVGGDPLAVYQVSYTISHEPMHEERYRQYYDDLGDEIDRLFALTAEKPEEAIPVLQRLIEQYPDFPTLQNYLSVAYQATGREAETNELVEQMYHAFPDYLFARLNYAHHFPHKGDLDRVAGILENKFEIKQLYPERDVFHASKILNFYSLVGEYLLAKGEPEKAVPYLDLLEKVDPAHPMTDWLALKLMATRLKKGFKKLFGNQGEV